jgi:uncharacterized protein (DUF58 family)
VRRSPSARLAGLLAVAGAGTVAGLASGRAGLAVLAAPYLLLAAVGLVLAEEPRVVGKLALERDRLLEGQTTRVTAALHNAGVSAVELELALVRTAKLALEPDGHALLRLAPGEKTEVVFNATPVRWGAHAVGPLILRARDRLGMTSWSGRLAGRLTMRVFPREQRLRALVAPLRTQPFLGSHVARARGDGIEFADIRSFAVGDLSRRVNWRATARRGALYVTERHPEHSSDVVLLLDTFAEARDGASGTLDAAVRAAASLARAHLARRDRVALVDFGGRLQWLEPAFGTTQLYRIIDALLASEIAFTYAWRAVDSIPRRVLPPGALILAITPLLDERSIGLVTDLRTRGADVTVIEVSPLARMVAGATPSETVAYRLWGLEREVLRARLRALGIGVAVWEGHEPLEAALEGVNAFRRSARHALRA